VRHESCRRESGPASVCALSVLARSWPVGVLIVCGWRVVGEIRATASSFATVRFRFRTARRVSGEFVQIIVQGFDAFRLTPREPSLDHWMDPGRGSRHPRRQRHLSVNQGMEQVLQGGVSHEVGGVELQLEGPLRSFIANSTL